MENDKYNKRWKKKFHETEAIPREESHYQSKNFCTEAGIIDLRPQPLSYGWPWVENKKENGQKNWRKYFSVKHDMSIAVSVSVILLGIVNSICVSFKEMIFCFKIYYASSVSDSDKR